MCKGTLAIRVPWRHDWVRPPRCSHKAGQLPTQGPMAASQEPRKRVPQPRKLAPLAAGPELRQLPASARGTKVLEPKDLAESSFTADHHGENAEIICSDRQYLSRAPNETHRAVPSSA